MRNQREKKNYVGQKFGLLTITKQYVGEDNRTHVECICGCGKISNKLLTEVKNRIRSCRKCQRRGCANKKPAGEASFNALYAQYRSNARNGGCGEPNKTFTLSQEDSKKLFRGNCFYCGEPPSRAYHPSRRYNGEFICNGIDRMDNTKGYTVENCVSCCSFCNYTKNNTSFVTFIEWIRKVHKTTEHLNLVDGTGNFVKI